MICYTVYKSVMYQFHFNQLVQTALMTAFSTVTWQTYFGTFYHEHWNEVVSSGDRKGSNNQISQNSSGTVTNEIIFGDKKTIYQVPKSQNKTSKKQKKEKPDIVVQENNGIINNGGINNTIKA